MVLNRIQQYFFSLLFLSFSYGVYFHNRFTSVSSLLIKCLNYLSLFFLIFSTIDATRIIPLTYFFLFISFLVALLIYLSIFVPTTLILSSIFLSTTQYSEPYNIVNHIVNL